jgi:hypothetical protein
MIKNKFLIFITTLLILTSSCEKTYQIGGYFVSELSRKPIIGLEVGLYQMNDSLPINSTWNDLNLLQSTFTDTSGRFLFEVTEEQQFGCMYLPVPSTDKNSVNSRYVLSDRNIDIVDWSSSNEWTLKPAAIAKLTFDKTQISESMTIRYENQLAFGITIDNNRIFQLSLTPGESHTIGLYDNRNGQEILIREFTIQLEPNIISENIISRIKQFTIEIKLENN